MTGTTNEKNLKPGVSYHIFLFPFQWDFKKESRSFENMDLRERTNLENVDALLYRSCWERKYFAVDTPRKFNEYIYFYDFVRGALYDPREKSPGILHRYNYLLPGNPRYIIHVKNNQHPYDLKIERIQLNLYTTGVGILSFHLSNQTYPQLQQILEINEFGRRIYPQFLGRQIPGKEVFTDKTKESFLADRLEIVIDENRGFQEDFSYFNDIEQVKNSPSRLSAVIMNLLGDSFMTSKPVDKKNRVLIAPILDDRMYVLCWFADKKLCTRLAGYSKNKETYRYAGDDDWYKLVFVDKASPTCNSIFMKKQLLLEHTYDRWIAKKDSSLFGITRYSFIILNDDQNSFVKDHLKTMYFQMVQLALVQRASVLRFSQEATRIANLESPGETTGRVRDLYEKYLQFLNKIYFREITAQEQGIELYERIHQAVKLEREVKELDREIDELHQYASLCEDRRKNKQLFILTVLGVLFIIPDFLTDLGISKPLNLIITLGIILLAFLSGFWLKSGKKWRIFLSMVILILILFMLVLPLLGIGSPVPGVVP
jgi:hypothetical protein